MATDTKVSFPTIPIGHFLTLRAQLKKSIPTSISTNYLASILNMTEGAASTNIIPGLKMIKLIDNDNKVNNERAKKFRDDEQYPVFCKDVLNDCYPKDLLETFPEIPTDKSSIKRWFMNHSGVGDNAAGKFASMFSLLLDANPNKVSEIKPSSNGTKAKPKEIKVKSNVTPIVETKASVVHNDESGHKHNNSSGNNSSHPTNPEVHVNVQVHISADATNEQIEKIFESMGKHLLTESNMEIAVKNLVTKLNSIQKEVDEQFLPKAEGNPSKKNQIVFEPIFKGTRSYIEKICHQINGAYENGWYDASSVMIRRLLETLIIELFEAKGIAHKIQNAGNFLYLRDLISLTLSETSWNLGRNTKTALGKFKDIGDKSAHSRRYIAVRQDIDEVKTELRAAVQELLLLADLKK